MIRHVRTDVTSLLFIVMAMCVARSISAEDTAEDAGGSLLYEESFTDGADHWQPTDGAAWKIVDQDGNKVYNQHSQSKYEPPYRSPLNYSLIKGVVATDFELTVRVQSTARDYPHRSVCLFFGYQDPAHFYYAHLGQRTDDHANQIFIVGGAPRTKISKKTTPGTPWDDEWHDVKITRDVSKGTIEVFFDDMDHPVMVAEDTTFTWGQVGIGSFDDSANWDDVKLSGTRHR